MKIFRKKITIIIIIVLLLLVGLVVMPAIIKVTPSKSENIDINYNNYQNANIVESTNGIFSIYNRFTTKLTLKNSEGSYKNIWGVKSPYQIFDSEIYYVSDGKLFKVNIESGKREKIIEDVAEFSVKDKDVFFTSQYQYKDDVIVGFKDLYRYEAESQKISVIAKNIEKYFVDDEAIYAIDVANAVYKISSDNFNQEHLCNLSISQYPYQALLQNSKLVVNMTPNKFQIIDLNTLEIVDASFIDNDYANNIYHINGDGEGVVYISFQATETDGSIVKKIDSKTNGLWIMSVEDGRFEQLSPVVYKDLYCFADILYGVKNGRLYEIDINSGEASLVS